MPAATRNPRALISQTVVSAPNSSQPPEATIIKSAPLLKLAIDNQRSQRSPRRVIAFCRSISFRKASRSG
jgi:hypothetical protein